MRRKTNSSTKKSEGFKLSRAAVNKIAAVEGINLDGEIEREFEEFDRLGLTEEQKLAAIKAKYAKPDK